MKEYMYMLRTMKEMDEEQLIEFFYDIEDINAIKRMSSAAEIFLKHNVISPEPEIEDVSNETSDYEDFKQLDDAQRYRDIKSTQDQFK